MNVKDELNRAAPVVDRINAAIRDNPLSAGLIGAGLAWMVFGTKGFGVLAGSAKTVTGAAASAAIDAGKGVQEGLRKAAADAAAAARNTAAAVANQAASIVPDMNTNLDKPTAAVSEASAAVREGVESAVSSGRDFGKVLHSRLSENLERQPLLLGAIGLAIGAGIASTFATTEVEGQLVGEQADKARHTLQNVVGDAKARASDVLSKVQEEASRQGLTLDAAKEAASSVAGKVKNVAGSAQEAVKKPFAAAP